MARTETTRPNDGLHRLVSGSILDDAATPDDAAVNVGFKPRYIRIVNVTDRIEFEWFFGMDSGSSMKTVAAGTRTLEAAEGPTIAADGMTVGFPVVQDKQYRYYVIG